MVKKERRVIQEELEQKVTTQFIISLFVSYPMPRQLDTVETPLFPLKPSTSSSAL